LSKSVTIFIENWIGQGYEQR